MGAKARLCKRDNMGDYSTALLREADLTERPGQWKIKLNYADTMGAGAQSH